MRIIIDPRLKYNYASYYLLGIYRLLENKDISYDVKPFLELSYNNLREYNSGFAFVVKYDDGTKRKVFIDTEASTDGINIINKFSYFFPCIMIFPLSRCYGK